MKFVSALALVVLLVFVAAEVEASPTCGFCPAIWRTACGQKGSCFKWFDNSCLLEAAECNGLGAYTEVASSNCDSGPFC